MLKDCVNPNFPLPGVVGGSFQHLPSANGSQSAFSYLSTTLDRKSIFIKWS
jgi:hypothetical protein